MRHKNDHNSGPRGPPRSIFNQNDPTMSPDVVACPKRVNKKLNIAVFEVFLGVLKWQKYYI